jgi:hypothetical protein
MKAIYDDDFYRARQRNTQDATNLVIERLLKIIPKPESAVDLGCGVGAWLATLRENGVGRILGLDGPWVKREFLAIKPDEFQQLDLTKSPDLDIRFDLAMSLEVAEHLSGRFADQFVRSLVSLSDFILFSAAPPLQGGTNHINEQPIDYWLEKFEQQGYVGIDCIRPHIWNDKRIGAFYRQNIFLAVRSSRVRELSLPTELPRPNAYLHPEIYLQKLEEANTVKGAWKLLRRAAKKRLSVPFAGKQVDNYLDHA